MLTGKPTEGERVELKLRIARQTTKGWLVSDGSVTCWLAREEASYDGEVFMVVKAVAERLELI